MKFEHKIVVVCYPFHETASYFCMRVQVFYCKSQYTPRMLPAHVVFMRNNDGQIVAIYDVWANLKIKAKNYVMKGLKGFKKMLVAIRKDPPYLYFLK